MINDFLHFKFQYLKTKPTVINVTATVACTATMLSVSLVINFQL